MKSIKSFNFQDLISNYSICNIYQNKIWQYGSLSANYLTNYLTVFGTIHIKETWLLQMVLSKFLLKCDTSKNLCGKAILGNNSASSTFLTSYETVFSFCLWEILETSISKSGHLQEVVTYERWWITRGSIYSDLTQKLLVFWRGGL